MSGCSRSARQPVARSARIEAWTSSAAPAGRARASRGQRGDDRGADEELTPLTAKVTAAELSSSSARPEGGPAMTHSAVMLMRAAFAAARSAGADEARHHGDDALRVGGAGGGAQRGEQRGQGDRAAGEGDEGEGAHRGGAQDVGRDHHHAPVVAVGEHAAERSQHDLGQDARCGRDPDPRRRPGALVDEGQQREVVQPVAMAAFTSSIEASPSSTIASAVASSVVSESVFASRPRNSGRFG